MITLMTLASLTTFIVFWVQVKAAEKKLSNDGVGSDEILDSL
jgi:hypothetical protein